MVFVELADELFAGGVERRRDGDLNFRVQIADVTFRRFDPLAFDS